MWFVYIDKAHSKTKIVQIKDKQGCLKHVTLQTTWFYKWLSYFTTEFEK